VSDTEDVIVRLGERNKRCHFCDEPQTFEVATTLTARCAHSPVGVCATHLAAGVRYTLSCPDAGYYVLVGIIGGGLASET
jgi:hypothetical protein